MPLHVQILVHSKQQGGTHWRFMEVLLSFPTTKCVQLLLKSGHTAPPNSIILPLRASRSLLSKFVKLTEQSFKAGRAYSLYGTLCNVRWQAVAHLLVTTGIDGCQPRTFCTRTGLLRGSGPYENSASKRSQRSALSQRVRTCKRLAPARSDTTMSGGI